MCDFIVTTVIVMFALSVTVLETFAVKMCRTVNFGMGQDLMY